MKLDSSAFVADPKLIEALSRRAIELSCGAESILFRQGDAAAGVYILHQGEVTLTMDSPRGEAILSGQAAAGSVLGLPGLVGNAPYTLTATARSGAKLGFVTRDDFTALMESDPQVSLKVLQVLAAEVRAARQAILER
ncbi:MAG: cyclic nucleotide-binding domain-containing protein [Terracidiphilus sp.]